MNEYFKNVQCKVKQRPNYISSKEEREKEGDKGEDERTWASAMVRPAF